MATRRVEIGSVGEQTRRNLHEIRRRQGLTLRQLAERMAESERPHPHNTISEIERGARRIDVDDLAALATALGITPGELLGAKAEYVTRAELRDLVIGILGEAAADGR